MKRYDYAKCGRIFNYMFLMIIPGIIIGIFTNERIMGSGTGVRVAGIVLSLLMGLVNAWFLLQLKTEDERYGKALIYHLAGIAINAVTKLIPQESSALRLVVALAGVAFSILLALNIYPAHADVCSVPDPELSRKWMTIQKLILITMGITFAASLLVFVAPAFSAFVLLAASILLIVTEIMELVALYRSARACTNYKGIENE